MFGRMSRLKREANRRADLLAEQMDILAKLKGDILEDISHAYMSAYTGSFVIHGLSSLIPLRGNDELKLSLMQSG